MMNRKNADRIIVSSNARMQMVLEWFAKNIGWLRQEEFKMPMESGVIELQEEQLEIAFRSRGVVVEMAIYVTTYGDLDNPADVCLECENCNEVVLDAGIYTLCARED